MLAGGGKNFQMTLQKTFFSLFAIKNNLPATHGRMFATLQKQRCKLNVKFTALSF
jgi:hypothetical protein